MKEIFERFEKRGTNYFLSIRKLSKAQRKKMRVGGRFMVTLGFGDRGRTYFLNLGPKSESYVAEKFGEGHITGDVKSYSEKLNEYFACGKRELLEELEELEFEVMS